MTDRLTYDQVIDLLHGYVVGALEPDEMLAVDEYVQRHRELLAEVAYLDDTVAHLALAAPQTPAPSFVKRELMARVFDDLSDTERAAIQTSRATPLRSGSVLPAAARPRPSPRPRPAGLTPRRGLPLWAATLGSVVAAGLILVVGAAYVNVQREATNLRAQLEVSETQISTLSQQIDILQQLLLDEQTLLAIFSKADRVIDLAGTDAAPGIDGRFYQAGAVGMLTVRGLAPLPLESTYQLWLIPAEGAPVPAGLLGNAGDTRSQRIEIPPEAAGYAAVGISIEPASGSPAPTGPIVALGQS